MSNKPKKIPPGPTRDAVVERFAKAKATATALAREIGVSRQYAGQLLRAHKRRAVESLTVEPEPKLETKVEAPTVEPKPETESNAGGIPPLPQTPEAAPPPAAAASNPLDDAMRGIPPEGGAGGEAGPGPFEPEVIGPAPSALDQKRVKAGRRLATLMGRGFGKTLARRVHGVAADDPRLKQLDEPNEILDLAMDENEDKMHKLGGLVKGWIGLGLGCFVEVFRVNEIFGSPPENQPMTRPRREAPPPAQESAASEGADAEPSTEGGSGVDFMKRDNIPGL